MGVKKIDTDWYSEDREAVKDYLYSKKELYCCDIVTFNTIALKGALKDVARAMGYSVEEAQNLSDEVDINEDKLRKKYPEMFKYVDLLNGVVISVGNHPSATVVSPFPVDEYFGTFTTSTDNRPISQINMKEIDGLNFVKLDILCLDNLGLIYKTCDEVGIPFATPDNIPPDDINVWNSIRDDSTLIFQWESETASQYVKRLFSDKTIARIKRYNKDFSYMDLFSVGNGALRPAGESYREQLANGIPKDNGHEALNDFLKPTLGFLVFQEQLMEFLHVFCGYTMGRADIVRRGFAKKTGTEKFIPEIKSGFLKTMKSQYGVDENEAEKLIVDFLKVIEDASDYLFSNNHSTSYSWIGYICGYLRYYYPLEFITVALNIFSDDQEKTLKIIEYAKSRGIKVSSIKFRKSVAEYRYDKDSNTIFKGIKSIKFMNDQVAEELFALRDERFDNFVSLLKKIRETSCNTKQLQILIDLDFFEEFGDANYLTEISALFNKYYGRSQLKKSDTDQLEITNIVRRYAEKETDRMFMKVDTLGMLSEMISTIDVKKRSLNDVIRSQATHLGYLDICDEKYANIVAILDVNTKLGTPRIRAHALKTGKVIEFKIGKRDFAKNTLQVGDVIKIVGKTMKPKMRKDTNGEWVTVTGTRELWVKSFIPTMVLR